MRKYLFNLLCIIALQATAVAQKSYTPMTPGTLCTYGQAGDVFATVTMGQVFCSVLDTVVLGSVPDMANQDSLFLFRMGFPFDAIYLGNTFRNEMSCSKGYYSDYILLSWDIGNNETKIKNFVIYRRPLGSNENFIAIAKLSPETRNWQDIYCEASLLYEYKVYAAGVFSNEIHLMNYSTAVGFRKPMGTVTGRVTYAGGTSVKGVSVLAETEDGFQSYSAGFDGYRSYLELIEKYSLTAGNQFTFQAWIKSEKDAKSYVFCKDDSICSVYLEGDMLTFSFGNKSIEQSFAEFKSGYFHLSALRKDSSLSLQLSNGDTTIVKTEIMSGLIVEADSINKVFIGQNALGTDRFEGAIDEVRIWNRALDSIEIAQDYSRLISGKEKGLMAYCRLDEAVGSYCYDISHRGYTYNENHFKMSDASWSTSVPSREQLSLKGITDENGNYIIAGIPYLSSGSTYTLTPMMGVHKFEQNQALRYMAAGADVHNNLDFTDKSSFTFKGHVRYVNTDFPVEGVSVKIDYDYAINGREPVTSAADGTFKVDVPIGHHKISLEKRGHVFSQGVFPPKSDPDSTYDFQENFVEPAKFYDATTARLSGRIVGGAVQSSKPLGFGLSSSNLGHGKIELMAVTSSGKLRKEKEVNFSAINNDSTNTSRYIIEGNSITIYPDTVTGEYEINLPPEQYVITSAVAGDLDNVTDQYVFDNAALGTIHLDVNTHDSSYYFNEFDSVGHTYHFNKKYNFTWRTTPKIEVSQNDKSVFGSSYFIYKEEGAEIDTVNTYNPQDGTYLFGYPVFIQNSNYKLRVRVFEEYKNLKTASKIEEIPLNEGTVYITNELSDESGEIYDTLNKYGYVAYSFFGGEPNLVGDYTKAISIKCEYIVEDEVKTIEWENPFKGIVLGGKSTGSDFVTTGPTNIITVLRDPPGSNSYAYLEKGEVFSSTKEWTSASLYNMESNVTSHLGVEQEYGFGLGVIKMVSTGVVSDLGGGVKISTEKISGRMTKSTVTTTERWETSSDPEYVGAMGDVFIGYSTNIVFGLTNNLSIQRDTSVTDSAVYKLTEVDGYSVQPEDNTAFAYSQAHIVEHLIPNLKRLRKAQFDSKPDIYIPHKDSSDPNYYKNTITDSKTNIDTVFGDAYDFVVKYQLPSDKERSTVDSVEIYTQWIEDWETILLNNEKAKISAIKSNNSLNKSFDAGTRYESSVTVESQDAQTESFSRVTYGTVNYTDGFKIMGLGFTSSTNHEFGGSEGSSSSDDHAVSTTYGYVLSDNNEGDYLSVDVYVDKAAGHGAIFRTRGGQTSCPYEGEVVAQYYQPLKGHSLSTATMQREVPEIAVEDPYQYNVPSTQAAVFDISLRNNSQADQTITYEIAVVGNSNPYGAVIKIDGAPLSSPRGIAIGAGAELQKKLTVERGTADNMKYENIGVVLRSLCQSSIADTVWLNAEFTPSCTDLTLISPLDKWTVNTETGSLLPVRVVDFNKNDGNFKSINLEYKPTSSSQWLPLAAFFADTTDVYKAYDGIKDIITGSDIKYYWDTRENDDRTYDLRATSVCSDNVVAYSNIVTGIKDTLRPTVFGTPSPTDGILSAGEDIKIKFNEPIETGLIQRSNLKVQGILNGAKIDHSASLQLNGEVSYAKADGFSFSDQSVTVEFWMQRDSSNNSGVVFAKGVGKERFEIQMLNDHELNIVLNLSEYLADVSACFTSDNPATSWHHYAVVYNKDAGTLSVYADDRIILDAVDASYDSKQLEPVYIGCSASKTNFLKANVQDVRVWSDDRTQSDVYANMYTQLSGNEADLSAYWALDQGYGSLVEDRASAHSLQLFSDWNIEPRGYAYAFNGTNQMLEIDGRSVVINKDKDATIEFWFKAPQQLNRACMFYNGIMDSVIEGKVPPTFGVYAEADGSISVSASGNTFTAVSAHYFDNSWHHFSLVLDRLTNIRTYIDGELQSQQDKSLIGDLNCVNISLGAKREYLTSDTARTALFFTGAIDELRIWETARKSDFISMYKNSKLFGDEQALVLYCPFERYTTMMGIKIMKSSLQDLTKADSIAGARVVGELAFTETAPAVKDARPKQELDITYVVNNDELLIQLPEDMASRYENRTLEISVEAISDRNGNLLASPAQWIAYVDKNTLIWDKRKIDIATTTGNRLTFTAEVINKSGEAKSFSVSNLPAWLSVDLASGIVPANSSIPVEFSVDEGTNFGSYQQMINLSGDYGYDEKLQVNLSVTAEAPKWTVDPSNYQFTMNVFGKLMIDSIISADENDMVAAFVGDQCRGVVSLVKLADFDIAEAMLPIYSNAESGEQIDLLIWDASEGAIYSNVSPVYTFEADKLYGSPAAPVTISCDRTLRKNYEFTKGWNWISVNVNNPEANSVQNFLNKVGSDGDEIKGQKMVFDKYSNLAGWSGSLTAAGGLDAKEMYKLKLTKPGTAQINGSPVAPAENPLVLLEGWNWIGYVPQYNISVNEALASYNPVEGDLIKSQHAFSMFYDRIGWIGSLNVLEPGKGYMLHASDSSKLIYPEKGLLKSNAVQPDLSFEGYNAGAFVSNMSIVAEIADPSISMADKILAAYNGTNCVGVAKPIVSQSGMRFYLLAGGNIPAYNIDFVLLDTVTGRKTAFVNKLTYCADSIVGAYDNPFLLKLSDKENVTKTSHSTFAKIYPSPFTTSFTVEGYLAQKSVIEITLSDELGREILSVDFQHEAGAYLIDLQDVTGTDISKLPIGWYSVELRTDADVFNFSVIKN